MRWNGLKRQIRQEMQPSNDQIDNALSTIRLVRRGSGRSTLPYSHGAAEPHRLRRCSTTHFLEWTLEAVAVAVAEHYLRMILFVTRKK